VTADVLLQLFRVTETVEREREDGEAPPELTRAYLRLLFAIGFARLGQPERALVLLQHGRQALPDGDTIHDFLGGLLETRVREALEGTLTTGWPARLDRHFDRLTHLERFKTHRVLEELTLLEPADVVDAFTAMYTVGWGPFGDPLAEAREALARYDVQPGFMRQRFVLALSRLDSRGLRLVADALTASAPVGALRAWTGILIASIDVGEEDLAARAELMIRDHALPSTESAFLLRILLVMRRLGRSRAAMEPIALAAERAMRRAPSRGLGAAVCRGLAELEVDGAAAQVLATPTPNAEDRNHLLRLGFLFHAQSEDLVALFRERWPGLTDRFNTNTHLGLSALLVTDGAITALTTTPLSLDSPAALVHEDWLMERGQVRGTLLRLLREGTSDLATLQETLDPHRAEISRELLP
jgi:hypothetical protein